MMMNERGDVFQLQYENIASNKQHNYNVYYHTHKHLELVQNCNEHLHLNQTRRYLILPAFEIV